MTDISSSAPAKTDEDNPLPISERARSTAIHTILKELV